MLLRAICPLGLEKDLRVIMRFSCLVIALLSGAALHAAEACENEISNGASQLDANVQAVDMGKTIASCAAGLGQGALESALGILSVALDVTRLLVPTRSTPSSDEITLKHWGMLVGDFKHLPADMRTKMLCMAIGFVGTEIAECSLTVCSKTFAELGLKAASKTALEASEAITRKSIASAASKATTSAITANATTTSITAVFNQTRAYIGALVKSPEARGEITTRASHFFSAMRKQLELQPQLAEAY